MELPRSSRPGAPIDAQDRRRPGQVRRIVRAYLRLWGLDDLAEAVELPVSELVTNAFLHGRGSVIEFRMWRDESFVRIEVGDGTTVTIPKGTPDDPLAESGRGLCLVAAYADRWELTEDGTRVRCAIRIPGGVR
ncbi:ATP-binding protein [Streptomyces katsurahamanus]|uniref:ATP-binding protein n=1 Tax=Streptomyces katsurahamanus TaxID=2577098 RepID=A0ABW9NR63_9ACTN|nr:ATP-binding protein [Streptomyces katsurahamanus]